MKDQTVHPASLDVQRLLVDCESRRERRGGPGGQHRNKVETAVVLRHLPTGIVAEANERRSQQHGNLNDIHCLASLFDLNPVEPPV